MKIFFVLFLSICLICNALGKIPAPEPPTESQDKASAIARDYTEEELKFHEQVHKDMPNLPRDTFKIVPTPFRNKTYMKELEEEAKKRKAAERDRDEEEMQKEMETVLQETYSKLEKMDKNELEKLTQKLSEEVKENEKKIRKGEL